MRFAKVLFLALSLVFCSETLSFDKAYSADRRGMEFDRGLDELAKQLTGPLRTREKVTIVVADFWDLNKRISGLGRHVGEEMATRLFKTAGRVRVIEGRLLNEVVQELCFNQTELFDRSQTQKLGRFIGADTLLVGTITDLDSTIRINARLIDTESRDTLSAGSVTIAKDSRIIRLLSIALEPEPLFNKKCQESINIQKNEQIVQNPSKEEPLFENNLIRVMVKSLIKSRGMLVLEVWYENLSETVITFVSSGWGRAYATDHSGTYLLSNDGEKWLFKEDTQVGNRHGGTELIPQQRLLNRIVFVPERNDTGNEFTYVGNYRVRWRNNEREHYRDEDFKVIIREIKPNTDRAFKQP